MKCDVSGFSLALNEVLDDYKVEINEQTEKAVDKAAKLVKAKLVLASPSGTGFGGHLKDSWKIKKGNGRRFIKNSKKVKGKGSANIPLVNILEYSTKHGHPFVDETLRSSENEVKSIFEQSMR